MRQPDVASCLDPRPIVLRKPEKDPVDRSGKWCGFRSAYARKPVPHRDTLDPIPRRVWSLPIKGGVL